MTLWSSSCEVLRGMHVEVQPLAVGRVRTFDPEPQGPAATSTIPDANRRSDRIAAEMHEVHREAERSGYEEGLRRGLAEAEAKGEAAVQKAIADAQALRASEREKLARVYASLEAAVKGCLREAEEDMVALCFETICRMVGDHALQPEAVRAQVLQRVSALVDAPGAAIHLHPEDAEFLEQDPQFLANGKGRIRCVPDPEVAVGGCVVRGAAGGIDARLETLLANCKRTLLAVRGRQPPSEGRP